MSVFMMLQVTGDATRIKAVMEANGNSSPEIPQMMAAAGVTTQPQISFWHPVDTPDAF